ncbi:uncharacterized protein BJ212DRAFT_1483770 [Suillus subaureus]|uniref:Uncharacterized protein n=1 Tax=Suillus subaureus TaxID=48587 RepID=A0A9P7JAW8_9AGAM|nr:uncharacterized protein BJ212DRAFT_1483770 [Suillus subaureus]KAG1811520.1 hypothetical protein BJ212DRAFT_1483770 [Suillus subaureus]
MTTPPSSSYTIASCDTTPQHYPLSPQLSTEPRLPSIPQEVQSEPPILTPTPEGTCPTRTHQLPARFRDEPPEPPPPVQPPPPPAIRRVILHVFDSLQTSINLFGIGREYHHRLTHNPDAFVSADQLSNFHPDSNPEPSNTRVVSSPKPPPWPCNQLSEAKVTQLVKEVLSVEDFSVQDLNGFNAHTEMGHFDLSEASLDDNDIFQRDSWKETAAEILVLTRERNPSGNGQPFTVPGFQYCPLTAMIRAAFSEAASKWFHFTPFKRFWMSPVTGQEQHLYDELYTSDAWIKAHDDLQKEKRSDSCTLERVIAGLMFWLDSTHLAQFGNASAWPVYLFFRNQSKYMRTCPTSGACHPVAFIPTLPEVINQFIAQITLVKRKSYEDVLAHCK